MRKNLRIWVLTALVGAGLAGLTAIGSAAYAGERSTSAMVTCTTGTNWDSCH